ncbi:MAG: hypothetical protein K2P78_02355 [Gemmataceae bacterium]|nr:hypothetical protein [Gemmataceae bacterium]
MNPDRTDTRPPADTPASPYGPHPRGVDEAAGGADSSPYDNEPTGERVDRAEEERRRDQQTPAGGRPGG